MPVFTFISPSHSVEESSFGNTLPTHRVDLPVSVSLIYTIPHRHIQRFVSMVIIIISSFSCSYTLTHLLYECVKMQAVLDTTVHVCLSSEKRSFYYYQ